MIEPLRKRTLQSQLCLFVAVLCMVQFLASCGGEVSENKNAPVVAGQPNTSLPMPPVSGKSLGELGWQLADGQRTLISDYKGRVLILDLYATWCLPCRRSIPQLVELQRTYRDRGVSVVGLNVGGPEDWPKVAEFARQLKIQYTLAVPEDELSELLLSDSQEIPQTFVFDRQGNLVKRLIGFAESDAAEIKAAVETATQSN